MKSFHTTDPDMVLTARTALATRAAVAFETTDGRMEGVVEAVVPAGNIQGKPAHRIELAAVPWFKRSPQASAAFHNSLRNP